MGLADLGYSPFFDTARQQLGLAEDALARVIAEYKESYRVKNLQGEYLARITGRQMFRAASREDYPAVGDWVAIEALEKDRAVIRQVLPRRTILKKRGGKAVQVIAANVDAAFIVESVDRDYNLNRLERYLVLAREGRIRPIIVLNKADLIPEMEIEIRVEQVRARFSDIDVLAASNLTAQGLAAIKSCLAPGQTYCFLGSSGVGKSSLINKLIGQEAIKTKEISRATGRGRHTTTGRQLYLLPGGGIVIDNPGMREVGLADDQAGLDDVFSEIEDLASGCRFADCLHRQEAGCAVLLAVREGRLDEAKYQNYLKLQKEAEHYRLTDLERRRKDRQFGRMVKNTIEQLKKLQ